jgi:hypothetical protein
MGRFFLWLGFFAEDFEQLMATIFVPQTPEDMKNMAKSFP